MAVYRREKMADECQSTQIGILLLFRMKAQNRVVGACIGELGLPHRLSALNNRNVFSHGSGGWKSKIKVSAGLVSSKASPGGLYVATLSLCCQMGFPLYVS